MSVIVLNADYTYLHHISWKRAINLVMQGKVEILKETERIIRGINKKVVVPLVVRLIKFVRKIYRNKVPMHKKNVFVRDEFICQYCGGSCRKQPTVDHIIPKSRGGLHTWENSVTACSRCNQRKGSRTPNEAKMTLLRQPVRPTINEFAQKKMKILGIKQVMDEIFQSV
jgi:5-methylcytosine-specific restriction endonuclease McrA